MKPDLEKLQQYSSVLFEKFWCLFPDEEKESFHVGIGTFIDKRLSPAMSENDALQHNPCLTEEGIGKCKPNYVFKNNVQLTSDTDEFKKELDRIVKAGFQIHSLLSPFFLYFCFRPNLKIHTRMVSVAILMSMKLVWMHSFNQQYVKILVGVKELEK